MKKILNKSIFAFDRILMTLSSFFLVIAVILSVINALTRAMGVRGILWADELSVILIVVMVFLLQPFLEFSGRQLNIGFLDNIKMPHKVNLALEVFRGIVIIVIIGYLAYYTLDTIERSARFNFTTAVLQFPRATLYMLMFASFVLTIINWIIKIIGKLGKTDTHAAVLAQANVSGGLGAAAKATAVAEAANTDDAGKSEVIEDVAPAADEAISDKEGSR